MAKDNSGYDTFDSLGGPTVPSDKGKSEASTSYQGAPGGKGEKPESAVEVEK